MKPFSTFSEMWSLGVSDSWFDKEYITPAQYDDHRHGEKEVFLPSPWRIHQITGGKQKEKPSSQLLLLLALPLHPTTPPGSYNKMKEEGPYSQRRH
ncbi:hypothetical protein O181_025515 [Austropuccinia psidii MF-1]|uniref:Uncharacterized protein n=1 Tax=Austropuccinia psidii MF-1 TaxID=1389203 RepID=A0A9Q3H182_9BASI|nr:hypothetical protein [Austropuccinia psidii MF-1]